MENLAPQQVEHWQHPVETSEKVAEQDDAQQEKLDHQEKAYEVEKALHEMHQQQSPQQQDQKYSCEQPEADREALQAAFEEVSLEPHEAESSAQPRKEVSQ